MRFPRRLPTLPSGRTVLAVLAVAAHVLAATGAPLPSSRLAPPEQPSIPYPCQDHPCGCVDSEACWAGDCCCFTLEQKLAWAEARGIEPPAHVRPAVETRKAAAAAAKPKKKPCCSEEKDTEPHACCEAGRHTEPEPAAKSGGVRWVAGIFAQKCRGGGAAGLLHPEPAVPPALPATRPAARSPRDFAPATTPVIVFTSHRPPTPPPRDASLPRA
jgi:hypothetical protein